MNIPIFNFFQHLSLANFLEEGFNEIKHEIFIFPGGEPHIKILSGEPVPTVISWRFNSSKDIIILLLAVNALRAKGITELHLYMPYIPFARQDRVMVEGEPLSIYVFAQLINSCQFKTVTVLDPHSEVSVALIDNCLPQYVSAFIPHLTDYTICCPDAGAEKKIYALCQNMGYKGEILFGRKHRNVETGKLESVEVMGTKMPEKILIVDDICDGGGTFTLLAEAIRHKRPGCRIELFVTHGIFSKGLPLEGIDHVYSTTSWQTLPETDYYTPISL